MEDMISRQALLETLYNLDITVGGRPANWNESKQAVIRLVETFAPAGTGAEEKPKKRKTAKKE